MNETAAMTPEERAELRRLHRERKTIRLYKGQPGIREDGYRHSCRTDGEFWPCVVSRLLDVLDRLESR